jgi:hypothetical protein
MGILALYGNLVEIAEFQLLALKVAFGAAVLLSCVRQVLLLKLPLAELYI